MHKCCKLFFSPYCSALLEHAHPVQILISYTIISNIPCNKMDWIPRLRFEVIHTFKTIISMYSTSCDINHSKPPELGGSYNSPFCNFENNAHIFYCKFRKTFNE